MAKSETLCDCVIEKLLRSSFSSLSYSEKLQTIQDGPPRPILNINTKLKSCVRHFNDNVYKSEHWLCGCKELNKLFCWSCLLFSTEKNVWNTSGYSDLNNIYRSEKSHNNSTSHISCEKALLLFGKNQRIELALSTQDRLTIAKHNEMVKQNRQILERLVGVTCLLGKLGLPFGDDESELSKNKGNFVEFVNEMARNDKIFKMHLENSNVFRSPSPDIQNDLIHSVGEVMIGKIKTELFKTNFVALILDDVSDIAVKPQFSATLRYVTEDGNVKERFLQFIDVDPDKKADSLLQHTLQILEDFDCVDKLVAQTYDGAAVPAEEHNILQARLRQHCETATFIHCHAHKLNLVLSQSVSFIKQVKIFFANLSSFSGFFTKSSNRTQALDTYLKNRIPSVTPTRWNFQSRSVQTVEEHKEDLEAFFQTIVENGEWDRESVFSARRLLNLLQDFDFNFFLVVFSAIFPHSERLFKNLQTKISDAGYCDKTIEGFKSHIENMRSEFSDIWNRIEKVLSENEPPSKRLCLDSTPEENKKSVTYELLFYEILDVVILNVTQRFSGISTLKFLNLLDSTQFPSFVKRFPDENFSCLLDTYGKLFDADRLKAELSVIYSDPDMKKGSAFELHKYIMSLQLSSVFPESSKLCCLVLTVSATSSSAESSCSYLKRIKTYLRNSHRQERVPALALMNIESALLEDMRSSPVFEETVMDVFAGLNRSRRFDLHFKN